MAKIKKDVTIITKGDQARALLDLFNNSSNLHVEYERPHFVEADLKGNPQGVVINKNASVTICALMDKKNVSALKNLISELKSD